MPGMCHASSSGSMKIVHVEDFLHPDAGYQVNLLGRLQVLQGHSIAVVTGELAKMPEYLTGFFGRDGIPARDERFFQETGVRIYRIPLIAFCSGRAIFRPIKLLRKVLSLSPDVVFVHGEDTVTGMVFTVLSRWLPFPIVLDCHMLEMASKNRFREAFRWFYRWFIAPIILRRRIPLIRVVDSDFVEKCLGIPLRYTDLLSFGTDTDYFRPDKAERVRAREQLGLRQESFVVLYAGKLDEQKGGKFLAAALLEKIEVLGGREVEILVVGSAVGSYGEQVERELARSENRIVRLPTQRYLDLARLYQLADLAVFPKQCSMSFFDVQSCGVPVLFEENQINSERAAAKGSVTFHAGDIADLRAKVCWMASLPGPEYASFADNARRYVVENYDYVPIAQKFTDVLSRARADWRPLRGSRTYDDKARGRVS